MSDRRLSTERTALIEQFRVLSTLSESLLALQESIIRALSRSQPYFSWTGFYMLDPDDPQMLALGPYVSGSNMCGLKLLVPRFCVFVTILFRK